MVPSPEQLQQILREVFGYVDFRPGQQEIVQSIMAGEDVLAVLPTGSGKSLCYQLPAVILPGMVVVVAPLIALMEDQVRALQQRGIAATCIHSGLPPAEVTQRLEGCLQGAYKLLYVAPERLQQPGFIQHLRRCPIAFVTVDEAHCVWQWGYDFRPAYLSIAAAIQQLGRRPILALTATATPEVQQEIIERLRLRSPRVFVLDTDRTNLVWRVEQGAGKRERLVAACTRWAGKAILIYAASRRRVEALAEFLCRRAISAAAYHAGLPAEERQRVQERFLSGQLPVLVATSAFGLGIDKPDIRAVVHYDPPLTLEAYYQEAGRAGRDGQLAECLLLYDPQDCTVQQRLIELSHPSWETAVRFYEAFRALVGRETVLPMQPVEIASRVHLPEPTVEVLLRLLEYQGLLQPMVPTGQITLRLRASREELWEYWSRSTVPERRQMVELLMRSVGAEGYHQPVSLSVAELSRRYGLSAEEIERGLRALLYARLIECETLWLQTGLAVQQPLPESLPLDPELLTARRQWAMEQFRQVLHYATTAQCKQLFLRHFFYRSSAGQPCGRCSSCTNQQAPVALSQQHRRRRVPPTAGRRADALEERHRLVYELARHGASLQAICTQTGLTAATVARLVQELLESGRELPRRSLVPDESFYRAVCIAVGRLGAAPLRDIAAALGGVTDYPLLRIAVAFARREGATCGRSSAG